MEIVFSPNENLKCVGITILNDNLFEEPETFGISITPSDGTLLTVTQNQAVVTIMSEDCKP